MKNKAAPFTSVADRSKVLNDLRRLKMARSAHGYVRGNTAHFYEWLEQSQNFIPDGPPIWICGDCHIGNLGPIANAKGRIQIEIRDLDQTVIGNPVHDIIRLGLSLASVARGSDLPGVMTAKMIEQLIEGYELAFDEDDDKDEEDHLMPKAVTAAMSLAMKRKWRQLALERIGKKTPSIPLGGNFWPISKDEKKGLYSLFDNEKMRRLATSLRGRDDDAKIDVLDAAFWVKGCSSLGNLRFAVLVQIGGDKGELCLMDVKEATTPLAPRHADSKMPKGNADRVAEGAWHLSPSLGDRLVPARIVYSSVFVRELLPQDLKFDIEHLEPFEALKVARFLAQVVGKSHARQMDMATRKTWLAELKRNRSKTLDAPSWLWSAVVEQIMAHEGAYLEHCRKYANQIG